MINEKERFFKHHLTSLNYFTSISGVGKSVLLMAPCHCFLNSSMKVKYLLLKECEWKGMAEIGSWLEMRSWNHILVRHLDSVTSDRFSLLFFIL